jgi:hypothetical protein
MAYNAVLVKQFADPDGDDAAYRKLAAQRKKNRRALIAEHKSKQ